MIGGDYMKIISTKKEQETLKQIAEVKASIECAMLGFNKYFNDEYRKKHKGLPNAAIVMDVNLNEAKIAIDKLFEDA